MNHSCIVNGVAMTSVVVAIASSGACASFGRKHLDYTGLAPADRLQVSSIDSREAPIATITDTAKVQYALDFILRRQDRWGDRVNPWVPSLVLEFHAKGQRLGGYGIGAKILVALPTEHGFWWRDVTEAEVNDLLKVLEVEFPTSRTPVK
jgi:hypothetical protein